MSTVLQDKVGPFARSAADAAVVLDIIRGQDPQDPSSFDTHLDDPFGINVQTLTVGYLPGTPAIVSSQPPVHLAKCSALDGLPTI